MKLEDIPKKQPFQIPDEAHFEAISNKIYAQLEQEENLNLEKKTKSIFISSSKKDSSKFHTFWVKPQFIGIAATLLLLLVALLGVYNYKSNTNLEEIATIENKKIQNIDFSKIPTEQINNFLLEEDISDQEVMSFMSTNSTLEINSVFEESDLNSIDDESLDLLLEEEYL